MVGKVLVGANAQRFLSTTGPTLANDFSFCRKNIELAGSSSCYAFPLLTNDFPWVAFGNVPPKPLAFCVWELSVKTE